MALSHVHTHRKEASGSFWFNLICITVLLSSHRRNSRQIARARRNWFLLIPRLAIYIFMMMTIILSNAVRASANHQVEWYSMELEYNSLTYQIGSIVVTIATRGADPQNLPHKRQILRNLFINVTDLGKLFWAKCYWGDKHCWQING